MSMSREPKSKIHIEILHPAGILMDIANQKTIQG
jgi:hypothetical protein